MLHLFFRSKMICGAVKFLYCSLGRGNRKVHFQRSHKANFHFSPLALFFFTECIEYPEEKTLLFPKISVVPFGVSLDEGAILFPI